MKLRSYKRYVGFTAGGLALLWMSTHGMTPQINPALKDTKEFVIEESVARKPAWREFFNRRDVVLSLAWVFAGPGSTSIMLPSDFNVFANTVYCIGPGAHGTASADPGNPPGSGGGGGAFVGSGTGIGGLVYNLHGPSSIINVQVGVADSNANTIFDASVNWIVADGASARNAGLASSSSGPSGCIKFSGGGGGLGTIGAQAGGGGGGAAGPNGAGVYGGDSSGNTPGPGGTGDNGNTAISASGVQFNGTSGPGGGGPGGSLSINGHNAGLYGAGGGGGGGSATQGLGTGGLIAVSYDPNVQAGPQILTGSGSLTTRAVVRFLTVATDAGSGNLKVSASQILPDNAQFSGAGNLKVDAIFLGKWPGSGAFLGSGQLSVNALSGKVVLNQPLSGAGQLSVVPVLQGVISANMAGGFGLSAVALVNPVPVRPAPTRRWSKHDVDSYVQGFNDLLPQGGAWPRDPDHVLQLFIKGLMQIWADPIEEEAALLLTQESDPRQTTILLPDWERNFGLPDNCLTPPANIADRRSALIYRMTLEGGQSIAFFVSLAALIGYQIDIEEFSPFMAGVSRCGDTSAENVIAGGDKFHPRWQIGPPEMRFYWTVALNNIGLSWFRASSGQAGVDPHLRIGIPADLECILRRYAPAHTQIVFDFSGIDRSNPLAGTP